MMESSFKRVQEMQSKTTVRYHHTLIRIATNKRRIIPSTGKDVANPKPSYVASESKKKKCKTYFGKQPGNFFVS